MEENTRGRKSTMAGRLPPQWLGGEEEEVLCAQIVVWHPLARVGEREKRKVSTWYWRHFGRRWCRVPVF